MEEEEKRECGGATKEKREYVNIGKHILTFKRPQIYSSSFFVERGRKKPVGKTPPIPTKKKQNSTE
jgi:hypothetical protein